MAPKRFSDIINTIQQAIVCQSSQPRYFNSWKQTDRPGKVFCRRTKLTLQVVFWLIVSRIVQTLPVCLSDFFSRMDLPAPSKSAFSMKRKLIKSSFFEDVNKSMVSKYYEDPAKLKTYHGYTVLACDGTRIALPNVEGLGDIYGYYHTVKGDPLYPTGKGTVFQDPLNNITVLARLVPKDEDERKTFEDNFSCANKLAGGNTIMTLDKGYFSYLLMFKMIMSDQLFVMKSKDASWRRAFIASRKKEDVAIIVPSRTSAIYRDERWQKKSDKTLAVRLVRFDHPDGSVDVLVTNIGKSRQFTANHIIELYRLRWGAETAYGVYKNSIAMELFSSFRPDGLLQDFHAAIIMYNLASIMASGCPVKTNKRKPDMNVAVGLIHILCPSLAWKMPGDKLKEILIRDIEYLSRYQIYITPNRSFKRIKRIRKTSGKFYRDINFAMAV